MVEECSIPPDLINIIRNMYVNSKGVLKKCTSALEDIYFYTFKGVKQGDGASPELFLLFIDRVYAYIL